ncbi:hypothetical protein SAMN04489751_0942 [Brevibacterium sandarakinum]|uniref:Uncharacterized protein n=1 Tax=Brevibacterium sandarakinum TaxID=629680 RepID=A0A1H1NG11_BRESA|nr:hypothetical protein [Brevibacterium sandarakinum]SDR97852.1 hypothetical protein SAMN04489751_0942 [Brevibacterium sandarakinum]
MTERQQLPGMALTPTQVASVRSLRYDFSQLLMEHRFVIDDVSFRRRLHNFQMSPARPVVRPVQPVAVLMS